MKLLSKQTDSCFSFYFRWEIMIWVMPYFLGIGWQNPKIVDIKINRSFLQYLYGKIEFFITKNVNNAKTEYRLLQYHFEQMNGT